MHEESHLLLDVEAKVDAGEPLTGKELGVLCYGITTDVRAFLGQHPELLV